MKEAPRFRLLQYLPPPRSLAQALQRTTLPLPLPAGRPQALPPAPFPKLLQEWDIALTIAP